MSIRRAVSPKIVVYLKHLIEKLKDFLKEVVLGICNEETIMHKAQYNPICSFKNLYAVCAHMCIAKDPDAHYPCNSRYPKNERVE